MAKTKRESAQAGRWFSRALTVVGGAIAGTAIAWAIGSASAAAETPDTLTPVTDAVVGGISDAGNGFADFAADASDAGSQAMQDFSAAADGPNARTHVADENAAEKARTAVNDFTNSALIQPVERTLGAVEHIAHKPEDAPRVLEETLTPPKELQEFGKAVWQLLSPEASHLGEFSLLAGLTETRQAHTFSADAVNTATSPAAANTEDLSVERAWTVALPDNADQNSVDTQDDVPSHPGRAPLAPMTLPVVPGSSTAGGHCDASLLGVPASAVNFANSAVTASSRFGVRHMPFEPGSQPGVTPD